MQREWIELLEYFPSGKRYSGTRNDGGRIWSLFVSLYVSLFEVVNKPSANNAVQALGQGRLDDEGLLIKPLLPKEIKLAGFPSFGGLRRNVEAALGLDRIWSFRYSEQKGVPSWNSCTIR